MSHITARPLTREGFAPFGDVIDCAGEPDKIINAGLCGRFHDRAKIDVGAGRVGLSLFQAELRSLPYELTLVERHPLGSQAFVPMSMNPFLVIAAEPGDIPGNIHAFLTQPGQGINFHKNTWHGVLTPLSGSGLFAVIDRIGAEPNLEEFPLPDPVMILP
ncbi:MAG: ureidoglycolate lyase [Pseudomonadota bacterium]